MNENLNLLIVEDNDVQKKLWEESVDLSNRSSEQKIVPVYATNLKEGLDAICNKKFDAAIIDLKLSGNSKKAEGNDIIKRIKAEKQFPIVVVSGYIADLEEENKNENAFFKMYSRDSKLFKEILAEILSVLVPLKKEMEQIKTDLQNYFDRSFQEIFWTHIAQSINEFINISDGGKNKILTRYTLMHLIEYLSANKALQESNQPEVTEASEKYYPPEVYIIPPINNDLSTGTLLEKKDSIELFIILTPACDMVIRKNGKRKAQKIVIVKIESIKEITDQIKKENIKNLLANNLNSYYHFLPKIEKFAGGFINFQSINAITETEINNEFSIIGKVTAPFIKDIIARFSSYYARQGQPEINSTYQMEEILNKKNKQ